MAGRDTVAARATMEGEYSGVGRGASGREHGGRLRFDPNSPALEALPLVRGLRSAGGQDLPAVRDAQQHQTVLSKKSYARHSPATERAIRDCVDELIIAWIAMGLTVGQMAINLKRSNKLIEYRWKDLKRRYGFSCYQDATRWALIHKLIPMKVKF